MNAHKLGSLEETSDQSQSNEILNRIEQLSNKIEQLSNRIKQPSIKTSHIITFHGYTAIVILPIKTVRDVTWLWLSLNRQKLYIEELITFMLIMLKIRITIM